ncbi:FUSC family protein [Streptomyces iconiensis]|uniref:FUSC family protein n=1 Tax=Streptomyces iconiensis TaxID=1384038 RepID=A0ABT7A308_9ACTN|nr:FUSC family protein [Streptomyces iconiensis]MDJ1135737.1 FUSC family protein [Streptomyces iconiensis]
MARLRELRLLRRRLRPARHLAGFGHPSWAGVAATIPLAGATAVVQAARATLRFVGTLAGIAVTYLLLAPGPPTWVLWIAVVASMLLAELFIARHYGIAVVGITPTALLTSHLASPAALRFLLVDRVVETAVGVLVSVVLLRAVRAVRRGASRRARGAGGVTGGVATADAQADRARQTCEE